LIVSQIEIIGKGVETGSSKPKGLIYSYIWSSIYKLFLWIQSRFRCWSY